MKKTYLKPETVSVNVITDSMIATSGGSLTDKPSRPGRGAKEQQGDWDNIWNDGGSN